MFFQKCNVRIANRFWSSHKASSHRSFLIKTKNLHKPILLKFLLLTFLFQRSVRRLLFDESINSAQTTFLKFLLLTFLFKEK